MANGGIIGPVVTPPNVQTQSAPGVWTLQEAQEYIRQGLWPRRYDPLYNYTTLLLSGNGANNATNSSFLDSSSNNFTVTRNGNTTQGTFSPFSQTGWGNYFDGTGDYLSVADNSVLRLGTSNFTIECWVNRAANGTAHSILAKGGASTGWLLEVTSGNVLQFTHTTTTITTSLPVYAGNWVHVAAVREGTGSNQFKLYINGTLAKTDTVATDFTQTDTLYIGANRSAATSMNGYISNLRITNGTALYTAQFTPSTTALTTTSQGALAAQVELLTCQSNRFVDNSGNGFTVTRNGDTSIQAFSPFNATTPWDPNLYGGSGYFDGSGDYLNLGGQSAFAFGTGDFTLEGWFYFNALGNAIYDARPSGTFGGNYLTVGVLSSGQVEILINTVQISAGAVTINQWTHIAITRSGTDLRLFVNGTQAGSTVTNSTNLINGASRPTIGVNGANTGVAYVNGYIGGYRVVTGTAVYTSNFTPPTAPLTNITNTSLLLNFTNGGVFDATSKNTLETVGDAKISTAQSKFGGSSIAFDGTGDYLVGKTTDLLSFNTGDFTVEMWIYPNSVAGAIVLLDTRASATDSGWAFYINSSSRLALFSSNADRITAASALSASTWTHIVLARSGSTLAVYMNGVQSATATYSTTMTCPGRISIASGFDNAAPLNGYIQDLRITKGVARYTENFAVPDSAFATLGNTPPSIDPYFDYTTLLLPGSGSNNATNNSFLDSSANNFTITRNGNTTQGTFSPFSQTGWGNYFDGTGDYLTATNNSAYDFGSGNFTIEAFAYPTTASQLAFCARGETTGFSGFILSTTNFLATTNGSSWDISISFTTALTANAWNHVALVRNGNVYTAYLNGVANGTTTVSGTIVAGTAALTIGRRSGQTDYSGYLSNFRIVKGTAVYTAAFSPPTSPLTPISGTSLLTCQSNRFIDNSSNAFAITANGNTSVVAFSPFNPSASWSAATYGGSGYFDGSGDYLNVTIGSTTIGSGDFTIELWYYPITFENYDTFFSTTRGANGFNIGTDASKSLVWYSSSARQIDAGSLVQYAWNHIAFTRTSNSLRAYINGSQVGATPTVSTNFSATNCWVGDLSASGSEPSHGYISGLRVVTQSLSSGATYTVPTAPPTAITNTSLLLNFTNAGIYDATSKNDLETVGDAKISTAQSVWTAYGSSMSFDGTGDYLVTNVSNADLYSFGTGNWTVEFWVRFNNTTGDGCIFDTRNATDTLNVSILRSTTTIIFQSGGATRITSGTITSDIWYHVAVARSGTSTKMFINGTQAGSTYTDSTSYTAGANRPIIGAVALSGFVGISALNGYVSDLRVTKGIARYTDNFQPPSAPLALR